MTRFFHQMLPPAVFNSFLTTVRTAIPDDYTELQRRLPDLGAA